MSVRLTSSHHPRESTREQVHSLRLKSTWGTSQHWDHAVLAPHAAHRLRLPLKRLRRNEPLLFPPCCLPLSEHYSVNTSMTAAAVNRNLQRTKCRLLSSWAAVWRAKGRHRLLNPPTEHSHVATNKEKKDLVLKKRKRTHIFSSTPDLR